MVLPPNVLYLLTQREFPLAAEVPAALPDCRAWLYAYYDTASARPFVVIRSEIHRSWLEPPGDDITQDHAEVFEEFRAEDEGQFVGLLRRWRDDPNRLVYPEDAGYPL